MSEQRIDHAADAAAGADADPGEGQGLVNDAVRRGGEAADPGERQEIEEGDRTDPSQRGEGDTEGARVTRSADDGT